MSEAPGLVQHPPGSSGLVRCTVKTTGQTSTKPPNRAFVFGKENSQPLSGSNGSNRIGTELGVPA